MIKYFTSPDFFSALIGALIGGFSAWYAAYYTMKKQRKLDEEQRRNERMPLLRIELKETMPDDLDFSVLGILDGKLVTSANPDSETVYPVLCISPDVAAAFHLRVTEVYAEPFGVMKNSSAFRPLPIQLLQDEKKQILFNYMDDINRNINLIIRFEYSDVFGNTYVQDAVFQYFETEYEGRRKKILEKREILRPQLKKKTNNDEQIEVKCLEEIVDMLDKSW